MTAARGVSESCHPMKLTIAGQDRAADLGPEIHAAANALVTAGTVSSRYAPTDSALVLGGARTEAEYLRELIRLVRLRSAISFAAPTPPHRNPLRRLAGALRAAVWNRLRYEHDHTVNQLNVQLKLLADTIEFQQQHFENILKSGPTNPVTDARTPPPGAST